MVGSQKSWSGRIEKWRGGNEEGELGREGRERRDRKERQ